MRSQQREGRSVAVLSGNLSPLIQRFCQEIGCETIATDMAEGGGGCYSGRVSGEVCIHEEKRVRVRRKVSQAGGVGGANPRAAAAAAGGGGDAVGVGNSKYDIPFLEEVGVGGGRGCVVRPSRRLRRVAEANGWEVLPVMAPGVRGVISGGLVGMMASMEAGILLFWGGLAASIAGRARILGLLGTRA